MTTSSSASRPSCPTPSSNRSAPTQVSAPPRTRSLQARRGRQRLLLLLPRRRRARSRRRSGCWSRSCTAPTPASSGPKLVVLGRPAACSSTSASVSTASANVEPSSSRARSTRSSTTPCATCSPSRRRACWCAPTCSAPSAGSTPAMSFHGDDVDLCWRAHISGARVLVVPGASAPPRALDERRPDLSHESLRARNRLRSMVTLTAGPRLPVRLLELVAVTIARARRRRVHRSRQRGVGFRARRVRGDPALPDLALAARARSPSCANAATMTCTNSNRTAATVSPRSAGPTTRSWSSASKRAAAPTTMAVPPQSSAAGVSVRSLRR